MRRTKSLAGYIALGVGCGGAFFGWLAWCADAFTWPWSLAVAATPLVIAPLAVAAFLDIRDALARTKGDAA